MTLEQAYQRLGYRPALQFEEEKLALLHGLGVPADFGVHGIGTTTRMLVEAALDVCCGLHVLVLQPTGRDARVTRSRVEGMAQDLGATAVQAQNVRTRLSLENLYYKDVNSADVTYRDHCRDPVTGVDVRVLGPLGWAHSVKRQGGAAGQQDLYDVFDRDGQMLMTITTSGLADLRARHHKPLIGP